MKHLYKFFWLLILGVFQVSCTDDDLLPSEPDNKNLPADVTYSEFADEYSVAFYITLDQFGGGMVTRADEVETRLQAIENYIDPQEFRVLFFSEDDKFLFEAKSRWQTEIDPKDGNKRWRVGIPVFQYLSDDYYQEDHGDGKNEGDKMESAYNWDAIVQYMKEHRFKVAVLANRPDKIKMPTLTDYEKNMGDKINNGYRIQWDDKIFGKVGPFWTPSNSYLSTEEHDDSEEKRITSIWDLHHCQYDPIYDAKNNTAGHFGAYEHIANFVWDKEISTLEKVPYMGAVSSWLGDEKRYITSDGLIGTQQEFKDKKSFKKGDNYNSQTLNERSFYRLPEDITNLGKDFGRINIPMYGIQVYEPLTDWTRGTTYNLSEQTASQAKNYPYKSVFLLRSVVKLELRIPMYDEKDQRVDINLNYAAIFHNNYMARSEPMDVSTPTDSIWFSNHKTECEWLNISKYGPFINSNSSTDNMPAFRNRMSWYYGIWAEKNNWDFNGEATLPTEGVPPYPRVFNPIVQRLQATYISNNFLPIGVGIEEFRNEEWKNGNRSGVYGHDDEWNITALPQTRQEAIAKFGGKYDISQGFYYRWVIYCGERNINDANTLGFLGSSSSSHGYVAFFRVELNGKLYKFPITDYSQCDNSANPLNALLKNTEEKITDLNREYDVKSTNVPPAMETYVDKLYNTPTEYLPYPLLRNHFYRMTVSLGDGDDINVQVMDSEERSIGDILFGKPRN